MTARASGPDLGLLGLLPEEWQGRLAALGEPPYRTRQIFRWIHQRGVFDADQMSDLPLLLRERLGAEGVLPPARVVRVQRSADGTRKLLLELSDQARVECVLIPMTRAGSDADAAAVDADEDEPEVPHGPPITLCVSTQVGCAMGCAFCLTGKMGLVRHLTAGEIAGQVRVLAGVLDMRNTAFNIVLMGMGEPLHNYDETMKALRMLAAPQGLGVSPRRITLSTVGLVPMLDKLAAEPLMPNLAISLHATTEEQRSAIVPPARKYSLRNLIDACRRFPVARRSRITFEYVMLRDVNDSPDDARRLARLLSGIRGKVNLIPLNAAAGIPFERPSDDRVDRFARILADKGVTTSVRKSRGRDIRAACGQLIVETQDRRSPAQRLSEAMGS